MEKLISVIVPVYNTGQYLRECVESILNQTYGNIELILVDDGSSDDSPSICDAYAGSDSRVKVIHKANGGLPKARESGILLSTGEYLYFVDSDDYVAEDALESVVNLMDESIDLVAAEENIDVVMNPEQYGNWFLEWHSIHVWGKLYRRAVVSNGWVFDFDRKITVAEDFITNLRCLKFLRRNVVVSSIKKYNYRQCGGSMVHKFRITPEYDALILSNALSVIPYIPFDIRRGSLMYQTGILEHFIYNDFKPDNDWVNSLRELSSEVSLPLYQRLVLFSADRKWMKGVVRVFSVVKKGYKLIKRKMRWGSLIQTSKSVLFL